MEDFSSGLGMRVLHASVPPGRHGDFSALAGRVMSTGRVGLWSDHETQQSAARPEAYIDPIAAADPLPSWDIPPVTSVKLNYVSQCRLLTEPQPGWQTSTAFVILGGWRVAEGQGRVFAPAAVRNARTSMEIEPGCRFFQVLLDVHDPDLFFLLEGFSDTEAVEYHSATSHFADFSQVAMPIFAGDRRLTIRGRLFGTNSDAK